MKSIFTLCVVCMLAISAMAQKHHDHFIVTNDGDTIYGALKYLSADGGIKNTITVKVSDTLKLTFSANEIVYFEEGMLEYVSMVPDGFKEKYFVRVWSIGYLELYEWEVPYSVNPSNLIEYRPLLRKKGDTQFIKLDHKHWKKQLAAVLADYKQLADDVKKGRYPMDEMGHVIDRYNEWKEDLEEGF